MERKNASSVNELEIAPEIITDNIQCEDDSAFVSTTASTSLSAPATNQVFTTTSLPAGTAILTTGDLKTHHIVAVVQDASMSPTPMTPSTPITPATPLSGKDKPTKYTWDEAIYNPDAVLPVRCRQQSAELFKARIGSGGKGKCIKMSDLWYTPTEFENLCGRGNSKDWKRSIRYGGRTLQCLIEEGILQPHATSCTCSSCCDDESVSGPVRLFIPYKRRKRGESESCSSPNPARKTLALTPIIKTNERSFSIDGHNGDNSGDPAELIPPETPKNIVTLEPTDPWWPLEEMANSLINQAQQLKVMIEQAKAQTNANKETALSHSKKGTCENCGRQAVSQCTGCRQVSYCSTFCQRRDWSTSHQLVCGQQAITLEEGDATPTHHVEEEKEEGEENTTMENSMDKGQTNSAAEAADETAA